MAMKLYCTGQGWVIQHTGKDRDRIVPLFGTDVLPTAFTAAMPAVEARREIARLNPDTPVLLADEF